MRVAYRNQIEEHLQMNGTAWSRGLEVSGGGTGVGSHAGLACVGADLVAGVANP